MNRRRSVLTLHNQISKDIHAQLRRASRGRYVWSPLVRRYIDAFTPEPNVGRAAPSDTPSLS